MHNQKKNAVTAALALVFAGVPTQAIRAQEIRPTELEAPQVEVIGTTPLPGLGVPVDEIPANVKAATDKDIERVQSINLPDFLEKSLPSVNVNEIQGNPYQPQVNYRGFSASPLLGEPQGISVFMDGVRINESFGDVVNWDLIPQNAISTINLIPGSDPLFGLNTLGGALSIRTKSGRYFPDTEASAYGGSWGRWSVEAQHGGYTDTKDYYIAGSWFQEDGWRDFSPGKVGQIFGKIGHEDGVNDIDLSVMLADTDLTGNGVTPESMLSQSWSQIYTRPDNTKNKLAMLTLSGSHVLQSELLLSGNAYYRRVNTNTLNGDVNDDFEDSDFDGAEGGIGCPGGPTIAGCDVDTGVNNTTETTTSSYGGGLQLSWVTDRNRLIGGASIDASSSDFTQSAGAGIFDPSRSVQQTGPTELENSLKGKNSTWSLFVTDTFSIRPDLFLTASARFNQTSVENTDEINPIPPNLDGDFTYSKLNPAVGLNYNPSEKFKTWAGWSQGNRAPTSIELGCSDPANPCTLPAGLASDPYLNQVVAQTWELGARGRLNEALNWSAAVYQTNLEDDILFVSTGTSAGFFTNFGKTRRQGFELGLNGQWQWLRWNANYAFIDATFQSSACLLSENNSTRGTSSCPSDDDILVSPGDNIPGIPQNQFNFNVQIGPSERWSVGVNVGVYSSQYARGNENNQHQPGTFTDNFGDTRTFQGPGYAGGYAVVNLTGRYRFARNWEVFGSIENLFDRQYYSGAILAENSFNTAGSFITNSEDWTRQTFFAPGAPIGAWIGVRYIFERPARK